LLAAALGAFLVLFFLSGKPYVLQIASAIGDTFWVFCWVSFDSPLGRGYDLTRKGVRQELPHILWIHGAFLALLTAVITIALWAQPRLPSYWRVEDSFRHMSLFDYVLVFVGAGICMTEVLVIRKLLSRIVLISDPDAFSS
jgi:hypothetical protein